MHISSSYAKILGEQLFGTWEIPRGGSKAKDGKEKKKERRLKVGNNNGQLHITTPPRVVHTNRMGQHNFRLISLSNISMKTEPIFSA